MSIKTSRLVWIISLCCFGLFSVGNAAEANNNFRATQGEVCKVPEHFPGAKYHTKSGLGVEEDKMDEQWLCSIDYNLSSGPNAVGVCPKLFALNPALLFVKIPENVTKETMEQSLCNVKGSKTKKLAKFKVSTDHACSSTPSILGYYHLSRILGDLLHIPVSVAKTVGVDYYKKKVDEALLATMSSKKSISNSWRSIGVAMGSKAEAKDKTNLLTENGKNVYGAMVKVMKKEKPYEEFPVTNNGNEWDEFKTSNQYYKLISTNKPISEIIPNQFTEINVQNMIAMRDTSNMLVMDYLMGQQDRSGNISYKEAYYWQESMVRGGHKINRAKINKLSPQLVKALKPIKIKEMALKDNDCGVSPSFENKIKDKHLLDQVFHMDRKTYRRLMWFRSILNKSETESFFKDELLFSADNWKTFQKNVIEASDMLEKKCKKGDLKLDLGLRYFAGKSVSTKVEECSVVKDYTDKKNKDESDDEDDGE